MPTITPCLWFDGRAEEAAEFYCSVFPDSRVVDVSRYPDELPEGMPGRPGEALVVTVELDGQPFMLLNAGPEFVPNEAVSFAIECADQAEMDHYWDALTANGGEESMCGWLKDPFGFSWQVVPRDEKRYFGGDPQEAARAHVALMGMRRIDLAALEAARSGS